MPRAALTPSEEGAVIARLLQLDPGTVTSIRAIVQMIHADGQPGLTLTRTVQILEANPNFLVQTNGTVTRL